MVQQITCATGRNVWARPAPPDIVERLLQVIRDYGPITAKSPGSVVMRWLEAAGPYVWADVDQGAIARLRGTMGQIGTSLPEGDEQAFFIVYLALASYQELVDVARVVLGYYASARHN